MNKRVSAENIAGINEATATLSPGTNVVQAENWQGKSSFVKSVQAAYGLTGVTSDLFEAVPHPIQNGKTEAEVTLTSEDGEEYTVNLLRANPGASTATRTGDPVISDKDVATHGRIFTVLDYTNPIRQLMRQSSPSETELLDLLKEPLDEDQIKAELNRLDHEIEDIREDLQAARDADRTIRQAQQRLNEIEDELETARKERDEAVERLDDDPEEIKAQEESADYDTRAPSTIRAELSSKEDRRNQISSTIGSREDRISRIESILDDLEEQKEEIDVGTKPEVDDEVKEIQDEINTLDEYERLLAEVRDLISDILSADVSLAAAMGDDDDTGPLSECPVCGGATSEDHLQEHYNVVRQRINEVGEKKEKLQADITDLQKRRQNYEERKDELEEIENKINENLEELEDQREKIADQQKQLENIEEDIEELEEELEAAKQERAEAEDSSDELVEALAAYDEARSTIQELTNEKEELQSKISDARDDEADIGELEDELTSLREERATVKDRREEVINELAQTFQEIMNEFIEVFNPSFELARVETTRKAGAEQITGLRLKVVRDGAEIPLDALSEGERELFGLMVVLVGHRVHDIGDQIDIIMIDEISSIAENHLHTLLDYIQEDAEYILTTAYPEAGKFDGNTLSPSEWDVVEDVTEPSQQPPTPS